MAQIQPFNGLRFTEKAGDIGQLCCPPYDIISEEERQAYLQTNPNNIIRLELPREGADFYQTAGDTLRRFLNDGILKCDDRPALYVYEMQFENDGEPMAVKGMICRVKLEEFSKGIILPHEETLSKAKEDRFQLMRATGCNFSQIYLLYTDPQRTTDQKIADATLRAAEVQCTDADEVVHRLWTLDDPALIDSICADFTDRRLYIADGHHRYETALRYRDDCRSRGIDAPGADYCMMMLVSMEHEGLLVLPTHRIVRDLPGFDPAAEAAKYTNDEVPGGGTTRHQYLFFCGTNNPAANAAAFKTAVRRRPKSLRIVSGRRRLPAADPAGSIGHADAVAGYFRRLPGVGRQRAAQAGLRAAVRDR